ncbi:Xre family transcriptional regulator [Dongia mobilis]|uniref:Xre family transcriptional regulator n=1 Tax=Dongia mobilis TaxID=578943 RepID=A0A4R6WTC9_9PROT|nr:helix-turn-helix transcriptional regulator [Dongia mobilis]TDQ86489.1 Xre family transcriptional regulator [Dongia mobilis]
MIAPRKQDLSRIAAPSIGDLVKHWRGLRRLSQLDLALSAGMSTRHLSFIETGRAAPSREMVMRLAAQLELPLRARNRLLLAAGFAPAYAERSIDDPDLAGIRAAIERLLAAQAPYPALAIDRHWNLLAANSSLTPLLAGAAPELTTPPVNVLRLALHPAGIAPRILNFAEWREHLMARLQRQIAASGDPVLGELAAELAAYPAAANSDVGSADEADIAVSLRLQGPTGPLAFLSTTMVFGAPHDVLLSELAIEIFLPADDATVAALQALAQ